MTQTWRITPRYDRYDGVSRLARMAAIYALLLCVLTHRHIFPRCNSTDKILQLLGPKKTCTLQIGDFTLKIELVWAAADVPSAACDVYSKTGLTMCS